MIRSLHRCAGSASRIVVRGPGLKGPFARLCPHANRSPTRASLALAASLGRAARAWQNHLRHAPRCWPCDVRRRRMSAAELAAARAERAARFAAHQETATSQSPPAPPTAPLWAEAAAEAAALSAAEAAAPSADLDGVLAGIELSGERDRVGTHRATEVDCRLWESAWKPVAAGSRVFTLNHGEGRLHDTRAETEVARARNIRFLTESARLIHQARSRGDAVWVHCTEVRKLPRQRLICRRADARQRRASTTGLRACSRTCCCTRRCPACTQHSAS